ncbi:hypothetical protein PGTUg99_019963 [Puccinia graminis f. sp. tritici]|uniref:Hydrophobin n=2 Tax=Puccinia graminis f. sp. tritici TaxID=56615 RepID=E3KK32_PUCGT|nr:uncharacterized protein PGTG_10816 [Puccinia graminis f. sp. tritici CRL 75-36-700-3]EFP84657.2 hypothetical protein PGTG_10816 [Puccinia graminis f. sp. tritici CRL 75-36-700-3]KAA1088685.1 hypothetical protein PGTUg99_019963 [Puccinia graminis f. sp. tritici]
MNLSNFFNSLLVVILIQGEALHVQSFDCKKEIYISGYDQAYCAIYGLDKPRYHPPPQQKKPGPLLPDPKPDPQPDPPGPPSHDGYSIVKPTVSNTGDNSCRSGEPTCCGSNVKVNTFVRMDVYENNCQPQT